MGLLDNFSLDNLDDPKKQALLAIGLGLLAPKQQKTSFLQDVGQSGLGGLQTYAKARADERANRQNELTQLAGTYKVLKDLDQQNRMNSVLTGKPYTPLPMLGQVESRLGTLAGGQPMQTNLGASPQPPVAPPSGVTPPPIPGPGMAPPSNSPMANPGYDPMMVRPPQAQQQPPSQPMGGIGGPAGGIPMAAWLAQDPSGGAYLKQLAEDNKPVALRQGDLVKRNPDGTYSSAYQQPPTVPGVLPNRDTNGQVQSFREAPGFAEAQGNIAAAKTGAQAAARAPYEIQMVENASGAKVPMTVAQLASKQPVAAGLPFISPPKASPQVASVTVTEPSKQAGDFFSDMPRIAQPQGLGQSTLQKTVSEEQGKAYAETAKSLAADADSANQRMAYNAAALKALPNSVTGPGAQGISQIKNFLVSRFSIPETLFSEKPSDTQELNKALINAATQKAKSIYGARLAQQEVMMQVNQASPALGMTKAAVKVLLDMDNKMSQYAITKANDFGEYSARGGDPMRFSGWYARKKPLAQELDLNEIPDASGRPPLASFNK